MASTSDDAKVGGKAVQKKPPFDVDKGLADHPALRSQLNYEYLEDLEDHDSAFPSTTFALATDFLQAFQDRDLASATRAFGQLVNGVAQMSELELAALRAIFPNAQVEARRITNTHYTVVMKKFLCDLMVSGTGIRGVPYPKEYALLLSRLSGELGSSCFDSDSSLDPADVAGCLGEMLTDMEKTWKMLQRDGELNKLREAWGPDVTVYVRRVTDNYVRCLLAAADALNQC